MTLRDSARETLEGGSVPLLVYDQTWYRRWLDLAAVRAIADDGVADSCEVDADLMRASRLERDPELRRARERREISIAHP